MTLEDFFTLTEMKDGLTALSRVEELVTVMQEEKDCAIKNASDATRQWTAVASTIAATENKHCLDRFINLDGLWFINRWLKDAQQLSSDANESFVEECITALIQALVKLLVDSERSKSSGIWITIKNLLGHQSCKVQDRAKLLFDSWKQESSEDKYISDVDDVSLSHDDGSSKPISNEDMPSLSGVPTSEGTVKSGETYTMELAKEMISLDIPSERDFVNINYHNNQLGIDKNLDGSNIDEESPTVENSTVSSIGGTTPSDPSFVVLKKGDVERLPDFSEANELTKNEKQAAGKVENSLSCLQKRVFVSSDADASSSLELMMQATVQNNCGTNENDSCQKLTSVDFQVASASVTMSVVGKVINGVTFVEDGDCRSKPSQDSSDNGNSLGKSEYAGTSFRMDDQGTVGEDKENARDEDKGIASDKDTESASDEDIDFRNAYDFSKPVMDSKLSAANHRRSVLEFDNGVDALEVARQVAQAIEREVEDFKGPFFSSEKIPLDEPKHLGSPDSINEKQDLPSEVLLKEEPTAPSHSAGAYLTGELQVRNVAELGAVPEDYTSQMIDIAQETEMNIEKGPCGFDLNEKISSDEMELPANLVSTPVPFVSASRPATPGLQASPLQFEGSLGWKGSAATSAFRRASPRKTLDSDKNHFVGGTSDSSSKQRQYFLDIDLNVAESGDDAGNEISALSGLPFWESSVEEIPKISNRFNLDLNTIEDDSGVIPSNLKAERQPLFNHLNGHLSLSPASSLSSMQPYVRNIDLNDRPSIIDSIEQGSGKSFQGVGAYLVPKPDASIISILGTRVEINRKDFVPQVCSLHNGKAVDAAVDATTRTRTGNFLGLASTGSCSHSPAFGYNCLTTGSTMSFSNMYGPGGSIPCMVDSQSTLMSENDSLFYTAQPFTQHPIIMSMTSGQLGFNSAGPSRPNFDLNAGFIGEGGGNRDSVMRPFFISDQGRPLEEQLRINSQPPTSSASSGKRKEPDGGWETYQFNYKQQQPPLWRQ